MTQEELLQTIKQAKEENLQELVLTESQLSELPKEISQLTNLQELYLSGNQLSELPKEISQLINLETLFLSGNQLSELPKEISQLTNIEWLDLYRNQLNEFPKEISQLTSLVRLYLSGNQLSEFPKEISQLTNLEWLDLNENQLSELPKEISQLTNLQMLDLNENQLSELPTEISQLTNLVRLDLSGNNLSELPNEISQLTNLERLNLRDNKFKIPSEILRYNENPQKILNYYFESVKGTPINEAKIVVVGEAGFGKSLLTHRLIHQTYKKTKSTHGIEISRWEDDVKVDGEDVSLNIWDFGGQEIMHSTHQFFFTKRTIYILVLNARENTETNNVEKWLSRIESLGGDSPIIIVGNKVDENARGADSNLGYFEIPQNELKRKYPNIKGFYGVCSNARKTKFDGLFEEFRNALIKEVSELKTIKELFPLKWFAVKDELENMKKKGIPHISYNKYIEKCVKAEITEEINQETLVEFLHDLGIVICFDNKIFKNTMVFNPEWVTSGVYAIIDNDHIKEDLKGVFDKKLLDNILDKKEYPTDENRQYILDMMKEFELCIDIVKDKTFLVPDLLPVDENYKDDWENTLGFQYKYKSFLRSIITRFIVRNYGYVYKKEYWKNGIVLQHDGSKALIRASNSENRVYISIIGNNERKNRSFLEIIRKEFNEIHKTFTNLGIKEEVPHPKYPNIIRSYERLITMENAGEEMEFCEELGERLPISDWLDGIESPEKRSSRRDSNQNKSLNIRRESSVQLSDANNSISQVSKKKIEIDELQASVSETTYKINQCDDEAEGNTKLYSLVPYGIFAIVTCVFIYLVLWLQLIDIRIGGFIYGLSMVIIAIFFSFKNLKEWSFTKLPEQMLEKEKKRLYKKFDVDIKQFEFDKNRLRELEAELRQLEK